jgi:ArsR family transcriptional regulator
MIGNQTKISLEFIQNAARILKTLGHPDRIKIVEYLEDGEKTVGQIHKNLDLIQPIVSQHLKVMLDSGIVSYRKEGTRYFYSLANAFILKILSCMSDAQEMISKGEWILEHHENN